MKTFQTFFLGAISLRSVMVIPAKICNFKPSQDIKESLLKRLYTSQPHKSLTAVVNKENCIFSCDVLYTDYIPSLLLIKLYVLIVSCKSMDIVESPSSTTTGCLLFIKGIRV